MECTCKISRAILCYNLTSYIEYCPLHAAAPHLLEACKKSGEALEVIIKILNDYRTSPDFNDRLDGWFTKNAWIVEEKIQPAIAKAEAAAPDWGRVRP